MDRHERSSVVWRVASLAAAWCWATGVVVFCHRYHFSQPSSPFIVVGKHTYYTNPPAQTLSQSDPVSVKIVTVAVGIALVIGTLDLVVRLVRRTTQAGIPTVVVGGLLTGFSLFGLVRGLVGIGIVGLLVVLSGLSLGQRDRSGSIPDSTAVQTATHA